MSEHDPFDGSYDGATQSAQAPLVGAPQERPQTEQAVQESAPAASEVARPQTYSRTQLERMRKAELQTAARERSLSTLGDRDDLIERIDEAQRAESHGS